MASLTDVTRYCDERTYRLQITDFDGAHNGLQLENSGAVHKIGAAVDAGIHPFRQAAKAGVSFLIVHHGMFWRPPIPMTGPMRRKVKMALDSDLAVYGSHLPLDCHPEIGNNAIIARLLELEISGWWLEYAGNAIAARVDKPDLNVNHLRKRLLSHFPQLVRVEYGPAYPKSIGILSGSGQSAVPKMVASGIDTLITGELKQEHFNYAQEFGLNLYLCGHYATEVFGVQALAEEVANHFGMDWEFIATECPL